MKNFTKKLALLLVFAMVLGVVAPGKVAKATGETKITINFQELYITVKYDGQNQDSYEYTQFVPKSGTTAPTDADFKAIKDKDWALVDTEFTSNKGDISWFNKKKASYAVARVWDTTGNKYAYIVSDLIQPQEDAVKVYYSDKNEAQATDKTPGYTSAQAIGNAKTGYFVFYKGKKTFQIISPTAIKFRKDGSYYTQSALIGSGTITYPFVEAIEDGMAKGVTLIVFQNKTAGSDDATGWPVKETKFKFAAQKAAPTVKLDITHVIPLKAGQEYRIVDASSTSKKVSAWVSVDTAHGKVENNKVKVGKILLEDLVVTKGGVTAANAIGDDFIEDGKLNPEALAAGKVKIQVRTAATAKGVASKIYSVVATQAAIADDALGKDVTVAYKVAYDKSKGITITNKTDDTYEYCLTLSGAAVTASDKWTAIKGKKSADVKSLQDKNKNDYTDIHIRKQGDKKAGLLSSNYVDQAISAIPSTPQAITAQTGTGAAIDGVGTFTYTTAGAVTITVPVANVSGKAIEGKTVSVPVTGMVNPGTLKWASKGSNRAYTLDVPTYADGNVTFKFGVKQDTAAGNSGEYKCKVESLEFVVKIVVQ